MRRTAFSTRFASIAFLAFPFAFATPCLAQAVAPLQIEDAVSARSFHVQGRLADISADGQLVAYTVCDPRRITVDDADENARLATTNAAYHSMGCDIWVSSLSGGEPRNITPDAGNNWGVSWSPDGRTLAFYSDRGGSPQLWTWDRKAGDSRRVTEATIRVRFGFEVPLWTPDGQQIVIKLFPEGMTQEELDGGSGRASPPTAAADSSTVVVHRSGPERSRDADVNTEEAEPILAPYMLADIGVVEVATGELRRIASKLRTSTLRLSLDGRQLAVLDYRGRAPSSPAADLAIVLIDLATGQARDVADVQQEFAGPLSFSPDGQWLAYTTRVEKGPPSGALASVADDSGDGDLYIVPVAGGEPRRFTGPPAGTFSTDVLPPLWSDDSRFLFAMGGGKLWQADVGSTTARAVPTAEDVGVRRILSASDGRRAWSSPDGLSVYVLTSDDRSKKQGFSRVELATGQATRLLEDDKIFDGAFTQPVVAPDGTHVVYRSESAYESADLMVADADFAEPRRLSDLNPQLRRYTFGRSRLIDFRHADGKPLRATLLLPADYQEGVRYPLVVWVYAGDNGSRALNRFGLVGYSAYNMHMLTTRGYAVLWPDIPVNTGTPMQDLMKAVMPAVDRVIDLGIADPDRLAVMGQSNGGYSTLSLVVQTTRFKAAVINAGFGDLTAFYGAMSDDGSGSWIPWLERLGGGMGVPPWQDPQRYVANSPIYYLDRIETPLIIQAGGADRAIVPYSDAVFVGLKRLGKDATYLRYGGEGHVLASYPNLVDYWTRVVAFLDEHLKSGEPTSASQ